MALSPSTRLGSYEILSLIGAGGMGEVYRAHDSRLDRNVAIKVLPAGLVHDADRLRRFEQEARAAGRLNHPNILIVHDIGTADGVPFLVSELLDGETLRDRLTAGRIPPQVALDFALQIVRGLQAAHDHGIVHRDLKPENLFVTRDGRIKILDFGLAKLLTPRTAPESVDTAIDQRTEPGMVMGTAGYMAPEQIRGEEADSRADIFAFGAVLYELLAGTRPFDGATRMDVMSAILQSDAPDVSTANPTVSPALNRIVRRCLKRLPSDRFQSAADLSFAIENLSAATTEVPALARASGPRVSRAGLGWIVAGIFGASLVALGWVHSHQSPDAPRLFAASIAAQGLSRGGAFIVSPDGRWLTYTSSEGGKTRLWLRSLDTLIVTTVAIPGTDGATQPFWSPDSQSLGFFADNELKVVGIHGGQPRPIAAVIEARGGAWGQDDVIVFGSDRRGPLYQVSAKTAGARTAATALDSSRKQTSHRWPHFLPDGRHFVYFARSADVEATGVYVGAVGEPASTFLVSASSDAVFGPPGFLLFVRDESLMAQEFDLVGLKMRGESIAIVPKVGFTLALNRGTFSVSDTGVLVYGATSDNRPVWFDRVHKELDAIAGPANYTNLSLAHNGRIATVERPDPGTGANDIHVIEFDRGGISSRFTTNPNSDARVVWTPDDTHVVWASIRTGDVYDLYSKSLAGGDEELLLKTENSKNPTDISSDGRFLFYESGSVSKTSLMVLPLSGEKQPFSLLGTGFNEAQARMSPDSRWISYTTDKDGSDQVYVIEAAAVLPQPGQSVVAPRPRGASSGRRVSPNGGTQALWRLDGKRQELYYLSPEHGLMAVPFTEAGPGLPVKLFDIDTVETNRTGQSYAPSRDGQRFLILTPVAESSPPAVVLNWAEALKRSR